MEENYVILQVGDTVNPDLVKTYKVPYDWVNPTISERKGETHFSKVDNPSIWSGFSFQPMFESGRYKTHCLPTGFVTVPINDMENVWWGV